MRVAKHRIRGSETKYYYLFFTDHLGRRERKIPAFVNKRQSDELARRVEDLVSARRGGGSLSPEQTAWLRTVAPDLRAKLAALDLIDATWAVMDKTLDDHLRDFEHFMRYEKEIKKPSERQTRQKIAKLRLFFDTAGWLYWRDITMQSARATLQRMKRGDYEYMRGRKMQKAPKGISDQTYDHYVEHLRHFCTWMVKRNRAAEYPLGDLNKIGKAGVRVHARTALTFNEAKALLDTTRASGEIDSGMTGEERYWVYRVTIELGLRADDVRSLSVASFDWSEATVRGVGKGRKRFGLPMRPDTAAGLRAFLVNKLPTAKAFGGTRRALTGRTSEMVRRDLEAAGVAYRNELGEVRDFHSLRHTCGTWHIAMGTPLPVVKELMRHEKIETTMRYVHAATPEFRRAIGALPDLSVAVGA